ncbi:hypothetical protein MTR67_007294 [Solanum verrucosum]|uniref:Gag-pol polyprotein n=1 Tax=Solanum verrucosum TaxID=315347 RepID=A0AAF0Q5V6_SOLVR|nr:hypothetical protein MTR67_007294 [Solanum verrucosum]
MAHIPNQLGEQKYNLANRRMDQRSRSSSPKFPKQFVEGVRTKGEKKHNSVVRRVDRLLEIQMENLVVHVSTLVGDFIMVDRVYRLCIVALMGYDTRADLKVLDMVDFYLILGMDWLYPYHTILNCCAKTVTLALPRIPIVEWRGSLSHSLKRVTSFIKARCLVEMGCLAYLAHIQDASVKTQMLDSIPMVSEFSEVFPIDLSGLPPDCDIDFCIYLDSGTQPISIPSYRMASTELKELKE